MSCDDTLRLLSCCCGFVTSLYEINPVLGVIAAIAIPIIFIIGVIALIIYAAYIVNQQTQDPLINPLGKSIESIGNLDNNLIQNIQTTNLTEHLDKVQNGLSVGEITGIVLGCVLAAALIGLFVLATKTNFFEKKPDDEFKFTDFHLPDAIKTLFQNK
jgi:hypothetical protein